MRNHRLIHFYFGIGYNLVWRSIKERLPKLISMLKKAVEEV